MKHTHFLDIPRETADDPDAPFAVLPLPYEITVSFGKGTADGPRAVIHASHEVEDYDEELDTAPTYHVQTLAEPDIVDVSEKTALENIRQAALPHMKAGRFLLAIGGEHTVTVPLAEAAAECFTDLSVLQLDAHLDLRETYGGNPLSHACAMKRIRDMDLHTVHCGIRSFSAEEAGMVKKENIPVFQARDIILSGNDSWINSVLDQLTGNVYLTIDIDAFDPSLVPGTGTPEPGGLNWYHVTGLLKALIKNKNVVSADIVEVAPIPGTNVSEFAAARLGAKIIAYQSLKQV